MTDRFGAVAIPLEEAEEGEATGDAGLYRLLAFSAAVLNATADEAWQTVAPGPSVVRTFQAHNPLEREFVDSDLPCLYGFRQRGKPEDWTADQQVDEGTITLFWVFEPTSQGRQRIRDTMINALMRALGVALRRGRHASWALNGDEDERAASLAADPDAIKTSIATSTSTATYEDSDLNGALGDDELSPRRGLTLTTSAATGAYNTTDPIVATYIDWAGEEQTVELQPTLANGGETLSTSDIEVKQVVSYDMPVQPLTTGAFQFGVKAYVGDGSVLVDATGFDRVRLQDWKPRQLMIQMTDVDKMGPYQAIEATLAVREFLTLGLEGDDDDSLDASFAHEDGTVLESAVYEVD